MKYYKVVREDNGKLFSVVISGAFQIEYQPNIWINKKPSTGGIFIFNSLDEAKRFARSFTSKVYVYECLVRNPRPLKYRAYHSSSYGIISDFWKIVDAFRQKRQKIDWNIVAKNSGYYSCPSGTYIANSIKLIKRV